MGLREMCSVHQKPVTDFVGRRCARCVADDADEAAAPLSIEQIDRATECVRSTLERVERFRSAGVFVRLYRDRLAQEVEATSPRSRAAVDDVLRSELHDLVDRWFE